MEEYQYQARIAVGKARDSKGMNLNAIGGVLISPKGQPEISDSEQWENIQCEIIIRPIKRLGEAKIKNLRIDMATQMLSDEGAWE